MKELKTEEEEDTVKLYFPKQQFGDDTPPISEENTPGCFQFQSPLKSPLKNKIERQDLQETQKKAPNISIDSISKLKSNSTRELKQNKKYNFTPLVSCNLELRSITLEQRKMSNVYPNRKSSLTMK